MRSWLRELREKKGYTQFGLAKEVGICQSYYASIELGTRGKHLPAATAKRIAETLDFDWTLFFDEAARAARETA